MQRGAGLLKRRPGLRGDLIAAILAGVLLALGDPIIMGGFPAGLAFVTVAVARAHQVLKTGVIVRKLAKELFVGRNFGHESLSPRQESDMGIQPTCFKGIVSMAWGCYR